jgi:hypothetical protein
MAQWTGSGGGAGGSVSGLTVSVIRPSQPPLIMDFGASYHEHLAIEQRALKIYSSNRTRLNDRDTLNHLPTKFSELIANK